MDEKVHSVYGDWQVFENGDMVNVKTQETITSDRLEENDWILSGRTYQWDLNDFFPAYFQACDLVNLSQVVMKIKYT